MAAAASSRDSVVRANSESRVSAVAVDDMDMFADDNSSKGACFFCCYIQGDHRQEKIKK